MSSASLMIHFLPCVLCFEYIFRHVFFLSVLASRNMKRFMPCCDMFWSAL